MRHSDPSIASSSRRRVAATCSKAIRRSSRPFALIAAGLVEFPVDGEVSVLAAELEGLHGDPADRFIAATAIQRGATLLTGDTHLLAWKHRVRRQDARK